MIKIRRFSIVILCLIVYLPSSGQTTIIKRQQANLKTNNSVRVSEGEYVDLGLPSGTLWATRNIGASKPEEFGGYFAWGETGGYKNKPELSFHNYKWWEGDGDDRWSIKIRKYNCGGTLINHGTEDNKGELDPEDDAAYVNWGSQWRMPTTEQFIELFRECKGYIRTKYKGVEGYILIGKNGKTLFFPVEKNSYGNYWSKTLHKGNPLYANYLFLAINNICEYSSIIRSAHLNIRAVKANSLCITCQGRGHQKCQSCNGTETREKATCTICKGTGRIPCVSCNGTGHK